MRNKPRIASRWMSTATAVGIVVQAVPGLAQAPGAAPSADPAPAPSGSTEASLPSAAAASQTDIVVTGSRIKRSATDSSAPSIAVDQQSLTDRGYTNLAQALNDLSFNAPALNQAAGDGTSSGSGQQFPNLFGLGAGRTLSLVNGRRMVTSSNGLGDAEVDANILPVGLLDRVEVVQAGGAAVYGSDAIAGVVNYVLKKHFSGVELDVQNGVATRGDYATHSARGTFGKNFADGRGNIAVDVEWSKTPGLAFDDRPPSNRSRVTQSSGNTDPNDGIPSVEQVLDARFWEFNKNGVIFKTPAPVAPFLTGYQFAQDGSLAAYNPGNVLGVPFATGGDGYRYSDLAGLRTAVDRISSNLVGHYDLTDHMTLSTELLYARTKGTEFPQGESHTVIGSAATDSGYIPFTISNPFLTDAAKAELSAISPNFAHGAPLFLSKYFNDLTPSGSQTTTTNTYRGLLALDGDFDVGSRNFYYSLSGSFARVEGHIRNWQVITDRFNTAIRATRDANGNIVCSINADAITSNDDPACSPINPFGDGNVSAAARNYIDTRAGEDYRNDQVDALATLGGSLFTLPAGDVKFSAAYEHRNEKADFSPLPANLAGTFGAGTPEVAQSGHYNTDELSGELLVPIVGGDFTLPLVHALELNAAYRYVDNSIAGKESVWNLGARWEPVKGVAFRVSRSRNFRAPTLTELVAPSSTTLTEIGQDACDSDRINAGPNPAARRKNCLALFEANPGYGVLADGSNAGASAAARLANFQDPSENFADTLVTSGGNPDLKNEISNTWTFGLVLQPRFVPGLTITADRIQVNLKDGLSAFETEDFIAACMDNDNPPASVCNAYTRLAQPDGSNPGGTVVAGTTTTFNAGIVRYRGEVYNVDYNVPLSNILGGSDKGMLDLQIEATHNALLTTSVTGETFTRTDDTVTEPTWEGRFDLRYSKGPFRFTYELYYLGKTRAGPDATIENNPNPIIHSNMTHAISAQYDFGKLTLRGGVTNLTDKMPSYPSLTYGDIIGRQVYIGAKVKL